MINFAIVGPFAHIQLLLRDGDYVDGNLLATEIRRYPGQPLPAVVANYVCRTLEGHLPKPRGRRPLTRLEQTVLKLTFARAYHYYLQRIRNRLSRSHHLVALGEKRGENKFHRVPANEVAARLTAKRLGVNPGGWRRIQNIVSSRD